MTMNQDNRKDPPDSTPNGAPPDGEGAATQAGGQLSSDPDGTPPRKRRRWGLAAMAALAVALFTVPLLRGPEKRSDSTGATASGAPAAGAGPACAASAGSVNFDFTLKDMDGADVRLADYKGKVVLLNFWATWCAPCKVEIPEFVDMYTKYRDRGFAVLGVLTQDEPSPEDLRAFTTQFKVNYPVLQTHEAFENAHGPIWGLPTTYIIDRHGSICRKHMGPVTKEMVEREIAGLL